MKRGHDDSDCDDLFDDNSHVTSSPSQSCHVMDRKRRRGVIEKRRRDRINQSLAELKRLVPSAFEKQGSAKLEKAEILQLTTEHLRSLQARGLNNPASFEVDYRAMGFRECVAEVARYLAAVEGMDLQNPLRMRLVGHLESYGAQKEVALKHELSTSGYSHWHHRLSAANYAASSQTALYPSTPPDTSLTVKLKEPSYAHSYHTSSTSYLAQNAGFSSSALVAQTGAGGNAAFPSVTGANVSPNYSLYSHGPSSGHIGNYNTDTYRFRPW